MAAYTSMILVEGKSEQTVLPELCRLCDIDRHFDIQAVNSLNELKKALKTMLKSSNTLRKLWVVIDADNNFQGAWQSVKDILLRSGKYSFNPKIEMPTDGFIIEPDDPEELTVGVWIMPNNSDIGMLEDFMMQLIPGDDSLIECATNIVTHLDNERELHPGLFKAVHKSKAKIHTWLAWHDSPGMSLSVAVQKRLFETDAELCRRFAAWLNNLNP